MARYEHLPIYKAAFDLAVLVERSVCRFNRLHKFGLGADVRQRVQGVLGLVVAANNSRDRLVLLLRLREELELLKILVRLCHEVGGFPGTPAYLQISAALVGVAQQNEGWIASMRQRTRSGSAPSVPVVAAGVP